MPAVAEPALVDAVALLERGHRPRPVDEVAVEVLLAGQVRAPGRDAAGAIVHGAERGEAGGIGGRSQQGMSREGPAQANGCVGGEAAAVAGRAHHPPAAAVQSHLDHGDAMRGLALGHLGGGPGLHAPGMEEAIVGVLMIDGEEAMGRVVPRRGEREEMEPVVMHARLRLLLRGTPARIRPEAGAFGDGIAPGIENLRSIARRHHDGVRGGDRDTRESEETAGVAGDGARAHSAGNEERGHRRQPARHEPSAGDACREHLAEITVPRAIGCDVGVVKAHGLPLSRCRRCRRGSRGGRSDSRRERTPAAGRWRPAPAGRGRGPRNR